MSDIAEIIDVKPKANPLSGSRGCRYSPDDFEIGQRVRLFLERSTSLKIAVSEGVVTDTGANRSRAPRLRLRVDRSGRLEPANQPEVDVVNNAGKTVQGRCYLKDVSPYVTAYLYTIIKNAQIVHASDG